MEASLFVRDFSRFSHVVFNGAKFKSNTVKSKLCANVSMARPQPVVLQGIHVCGMLACYANRTRVFTLSVCRASQQWKLRLNPLVDPHVFPAGPHRLLSGSLTGLLLLYFSSSSPGKRTEEAPEARRSAEALDA